MLTDFIKSSTRPLLGVGFRRCMLLGLVAIGCGGGDWRAETQPASGSITINGKKPEGAIVRFHPTKEAIDVRESKPWGLVGSDGTYRLRTYEKGDGAPVGTYHVTVEWLDNPHVPGAVDLLGGAYADPDRSKTKITIKEGQTELPPIEITGARVMMNPARKRRQATPFDVSANGT